MLKNYVIYKHTSPSGKSYIGQTNNRQRRERQHRNRIECRAFASAIKKYGWANFEHSILEENLTLEEANIKEQFYIAEHNTIFPNGYNLTSGGFNCMYTEETRKLQSHARKNYYNHNPDAIKFIGDIHRGKTMTHESRLKISNSSKGRQVSDQTRSKISQKNLGKKRTADQIKNHPMTGLKGEKHPCYGMKRSKETCDRISKSLLGDKHPQFGKVGKLNKSSKTYQITFPDGRVEIITGLHQFCRENNLNPSHMVAVSKQKRKSHKGFLCEIINK